MEANLLQPCLLSSQHRCPHCRLPLFSQVIPNASSSRCPISPTITPTTTPTTTPSLFYVSSFVSLLDRSYQYINVHPLKRNKQHSLIPITATNCHPGFLQQSFKQSFTFTVRGFSSAIPFYTCSGLSPDLSLCGSCFVKFISDPTLLNPVGSFQSPSSWPGSGVWPSSSLPPPPCSFFPWYPAHLSTCSLLSVACWSISFGGFFPFLQTFNDRGPRVQSPVLFSLSAHPFGESKQP